MYLAVSEATRLLIVGEWARALAEIDGVLPLFDGPVYGAPHLYNLAQGVGMFAVEKLGRVAELAERCGDWYRRALDCNDLFGRMTAGFIQGPARLALDDVAGMRRAAEDAYRLWSRRDYHVQHFYAMRFEVLSISTRATPPAGPLVSPPRGSRCASRRCCACSSRASTRIRSARRRRSRLEAGGPKNGRKQRGQTWTGSHASSAATPTAALLGAALRRLDGDDEGALAGLRAAADGFDASGMELAAAAARHRLGELQGGDEGGALVAGAAATLARLGVRRPSSWLRIAAPGLSPRAGATT